MLSGRYRNGLSLLGTVAIGAVVWSGLTALRDLLGSPIALSASVAIAFAAHCLCSDDSDPG